MRHGAHTNGQRLLSFSEISTAMTCEAQWDFSYGDQLAGSALKRKLTAPILREGRAWGAAVAAYHATQGTLLEDQAGSLAITSLDASLDDDAERQRELGVHDAEVQDEIRARLLAILAHYIDTTGRFALNPTTEHELLVSIPSRSGKGSSNRYKFLAYLDGTRQRDGDLWIVEFKLRGTLTPVELIQLSRQIRWYAWAWWQAMGEKPRGVEVHERINEAPKPPRILKSGKPSHAKDQLCTADAYRAACEEHDEEVNEATFESLAARRWQQIVPIMFRDGELEEAGRELVAAAKRISDLDSGRLIPVRNASPRICRGCAFKDICPAPDNDLVDALFERVPAKRNRHNEEGAAA